MTRIVFEKGAPAVAGYSRAQVQTFIVYGEFPLAHRMLGGGVYYVYDDLVAFRERARRDKKFRARIEYLAGIRDEY